MALNNLNLSGLRYLALFCLLGSQGCVLPITRFSTSERYLIRDKTAVRQVSQRSVTTIPGGGEYVVEESSFEPIKRRSGAAALTKAPSGLHPIQTETMRK